MKPKWDKTEWKSLLGRLSRLATQQVEWGFFADKVYPSDYPNPATRGLPVALVASLNEYGTGKAPARPFMRLNALGLAKDKQMIQQVVVPLLIDVLQKRPYNYKLMVYGELLAKSLQLDMEDYRMTPDAPAPDNALSWAKFKGKNKPLDYTGYMIESVESRVVPI